MVLVLTIFQSKPVLPDASRQWLWDAYGWALRQFDAGVFYHETSLVTPSNKHFPGRANSVHAMAELIFNQVKTHAGVHHWPCRLWDPSLALPEPAPILQVEGPLRGSHAVMPVNTDPCHVLAVPYNPHQVNKPQALIADFAHILAHYLGTTATEPPPGGPDNWPYATELVAIFMGFGIMFANSAYTFRGGCGSCYNPLAERTAYLSQDEATYALALFCVLKDIPNADVLKELKSYLRAVYKKAVKEIRRDRVAMANLEQNRLAQMAEVSPTLKVDRFPDRIAGH